MPRSIFLENLKYFFGLTDGTYRYPQGAVGDLLKQAKVELEANADAARYRFLRGHGVQVLDELLVGDALDTAIDAELGTAPAPTAPTSKERVYREALQRIIAGQPDIDTPADQVRWMWSVANNAVECANGLPDATGSVDGYKDAFYQIAELLDMTAMPISPKEAFETAMLPRLRELVAGKTAAVETREKYKPCAHNGGKHEFENLKRNQFDKCIHCGEPRFAVKTAAVETPARAAPTPNQYCSRYMDDAPGVRADCESHLSGGRACVDCPHRNIDAEVRDLRKASPGGG